MLIGIFAPNVECNTFTLAHALAEGGHTVIVVAPLSTNTRPANDSYSNVLRRQPGVSVTREPPAQRDRWDALIVEAWRNTDRAALLATAQRSKRVIILCETQPTTTWHTIKSELRELLVHFPLSLRCRRFVYLGGVPRLGPYAILGVRTMLGYDAHSLFLLPGPLQGSAFAFDWNPGARRRFCLNFMGNTEPATRAAVVDDLAGYLATLGHPMVSSAKTGSLVGEDDGPQVLWTPNTPLPPEEYLRFLSESDFTLSPPGYLPVTHRTVESLLQGSIPILNERELPLYCVGLRDSENCLAVHNGDWRAAIQQALAMTWEERVVMRRNILAMRAEYLEDSVNCRHIRSRLGIA